MTTLVPTPAMPSTTKDYPPTLIADFYKISHRKQYPEGTEVVYSNWTPRESRVTGIDHVVAFSFQAFVKRYLVDSFNEYFFAKPLEEVLFEYARVIKNTLGIEAPDTTHLEALWNLGYLPLRIKALPEGSLVPLRVPMFTIQNTHPEFFWLTNYFETVFSAECWQPSTSASTAFEYRKLLEHFAKETGGDPSTIPFQGHDFSFRGMPGIHAAAASGAGHLLSFVGTDTIPSILYHERFYGANSDVELVGTSIPATEHSVMCAYGNEGDAEFEAFKRLITVLYPDGFVSTVADTWDLFDVLGDYLPRLRTEVLARNGRLVIRPDSGDPVDIIAGRDDHALGDLLKGAADSKALLRHKGVVEALWDIFGGTINDMGYKVLDPHIGAIYGDSITLERAEAILSRLQAKGFASTNIVFGIGSYTYQYVTRDTFGSALKATSVTINGVEKAIYKDPVTDTNHMKRSLKGRVAVVEVNGDLEVISNLTALDVIDGDLLDVIFEDGKAYNFQTLAEIRDRLLSRVPA
jgi:nicotinamide phosphoribosyltransferase